MPPPTSTPPAAQAPPAAPVDRFTCADAPRLLGHPDHTVQVCREVAALKGLYKVVLAHPTAGSVGVLVPTDADGKVETARGPVAATAWMRRTGVLDREGVGMLHIMMFLSAFEALPAPLTLDAQDFDDAAVGTPSFQAKPLRLELFADVTPEGTPGVRRYVRGVLAAGADGKLAWTLEQGPGPGAWAPLATVPAE